MSGLLVTNLNAITATATYGTAPAITASSEASAANLAVITTDSPAAAASSTAPAPSALDRWLESLAAKESGNRAGIKILDVNGRYSYGCLQFQMATFRSYSARYGLVDPAAVTSWEELLYDCSLQKRIAKRMIQENPANWRHWAYTVLNKGIGKPPAEQAVEAELADAQ